MHLVPEQEQLSTCKKKWAEQKFKTHKSLERFFSIKQKLKSYSHTNNMIWNYVYEIMYCEVTMFVN